MLKEAENKETRFFCHIVFIDGISIGAGPQLGGEAKGGGAPLNKNLPPPLKMHSMPTQTPLFLAEVLRWWLFLLETNRKLEDKYNNLAR